jgi:ATP-dependent Lon protease
MRSKNVESSSSSDDSEEETIFETDSNSDSNSDSDSNSESDSEESVSVSEKEVKKRKSNKTKKSKKKNVQKIAQKKNARKHRKMAEKESDDSDEYDDDEDHEMDENELRKIISKIFPSKYMNDRAKMKMKKKNVLDQDDYDSEDDSDYEPKKSKKSTKKRTVSKKSKKSTKKRTNDDDDDDEDSESEDEDDVEDSESEDDESSESESETESESESESETESEKEKHKRKSKSAAAAAAAKKSKKRKEVEQSDEEDESESDDDSSEDDDDENKINIVLSIEEEKEYNELFGDGYMTPVDDDEECDSDDEKMFMRENYEEMPKLESSSAEMQSDKKSKSKKDIKKQKEKDRKKKEKDRKKKEKDQENVIDLGEDVEDEYLELIDLKKRLTEKLAKRPKSKVLLKSIEDCKNAINKLVKKNRAKNTKKYFKLINTERNRMDEIDYFKKKMSNKEQRRIMKDMVEINKHINIEKPYRLLLLESDIPPKMKAIALQKLNVLKSMEIGDPEYYKIKNWVDTFMRIPFSKYKSLNVNINDGIEVCHSFMESAKKTLDECVYGLDDAKLQIMQMVGQWISNPAAMGTAIAIKGPPGTGKTTLIKDGISKILGREFVFIPLGGTGDASFLEGHSYTYEGSSWGKIIQSLIDSKCMNPVFYFDELDKISDTPRGEEIVGILTHLTDTSQNSQFHDKYFSDIDFDLSKSLFIFSYNDEAKVNPILKDRMYRILTKGYDSKEKIVIARNYMLPKIREQVNFMNEDIIIPDDTIQYIVSTQHLTQNEDGVRNMKRCLEIIHTKLNLFRLMKSDQNLFSKEIGMDVVFPITVTRKHVDILIKKEDPMNQSVLHSMYV